VTEPTPPDDSVAEDQPEEVCLATMILELQQEHRDLDVEIASMYEYPYRDQLLLQRMKKRKLRIKDTIERLKDDLIPDLNA
jgi:hypothetical protein